MVFVKPRAKGSNTVDQQIPTLLDVTCCVRLHELKGVQIGRSADKTRDRTDKEVSSGDFVHRITF